MDDLCEHPDFEAHVRVNRIEDRRRFIAEVQVRCVKCRVRFRWVGVPMGLSFSQPKVSIDHFELRGPIEPDAHGTMLMAGDLETAFPAAPPTGETSNA